MHQVTSAASLRETEKSVPKPSSSYSRPVTKTIESLRVVGGAALAGEVSVLGAKNAALKLMVATLLAPGTHQLTNVPRNLDVEIMCDVLRHVGADCERDGTDLEVTVPESPLPEAPLELVRQMRASILILGTLLARTGEARVALPGGDDFGSRPIDLHLNGLEALGAVLDLRHGVLRATAPDGLHGADIYLDFPSVGATENILLAAVLAAACFAAIVQLAWSHAAAHGLSGMAALAYGPAVAALLPGTGRIGELGSLLATIVPHIY